MPCCNLLEIDCSTGTVNVSRHNFSGYAPWLEAGKTVNIDLSGGAECCTSETDCKILENKEQFAAQVLELALLYNLTGFTMEWEFGKAWYWAGYNQTMSFVAEKLKPHGIGLGISINSACERAAYASGAGPSCCPAYRNVPWAAVLTDMGTYRPGAGASEHCRRDGPPSACNAKCKNDSTNDPSIIQYCGFEGNVLNVLDSPVATVHADRWPQLSPAMWFGDCWANGSGTSHGWTQQKLRRFLAFLDTQGILSVGIWCMAELPCGGVEPDHNGHNHSYRPNCPWMYEELRAWRHRPTTRP